MQEEEMKQPTDTAPQSKAAPILIIVLVILAVLAAVFFVMGKQATPEPETAEVPEDLIPVESTEPTTEQIIEDTELNNDTLTKVEGLIPMVTGFVTGTFIPDDQSYNRVTVLVETYAADELATRIMGSESTGHIITVFIDDTTTLTGGTLTEITGGAPIEVILHSDLRENTELGGFVANEVIIEG